FLAGALWELIVRYFWRHLPLYVALILLFVTGLGFGALATHKLSPVQKEDLSSYISAVYLTLRSEEHTSELQSRENLVCRLLLVRAALLPVLRAFPPRRSSDLFLAGALWELIVRYFWRHLPLYVALILLFVTGLGFGALATHKLSPVQKEDLSSYISAVYLTL